MKEFLLRSQGCPPSHSQTNRVDGTSLLIAKAQILNRWVEHFRSVLIHPSTISDAAIAPLPQVETNADLDLAPSLHETIRAVQQLTSGKTPGSDAISAEIHKRGAPQLMNHLTTLFQEMRRQGKFAGFQGRHNRPSLLAKRELPTLRQPPRHCAAQPSRKDLRWHFTQPSEQTSGTGSPAGKPVGLPPSLWDHRHDFHSPPTARDAEPPQLYLWGSDKSLRYNES
nr:unnamed protein product [Spirometra erinaceieuropaei]